MSFFGRRETNEDSERRRRKAIEMDLEDEQSARQKETRKRKEVERKLEESRRLYNEVQDTVVCLQEERNSIEMLLNSAMDTISKAFWDLEAARFDDAERCDECRHLYCRDCVDEKFLNMRCPLCQDEGGHLGGGDGGLGMTETWEEFTRRLAPKHLQVYDACMTMAAKHPGPYTATPWIHLADAVERGSVSPMEAYDTIRLGYVAEHLLTRYSRYKHLL